MNALSYIPAPVPMVTIECEHCGGSGTVLETMRWSGEGNGGEWIETDCEQCGGVGSWEEPASDCGECDCPLIDGRCPEGCRF